MRVPSLTPGLIFTVYVFSRRSRPEPWQRAHGCSITVPLPRQRGHGCESANRPWLSDFTPRPLHSGQMTGAVPGCAPVPPHSRQATVSSTGTFASAPRSESSNERCTSASTSLPRTGCRRVAAPPARPPKIPPSRSLTSKPPKSKLPKSTFGPPAPGRPFCDPKRSYCFRFSASERTSYAVCTSLKRSSASLSPAFLSTPRLSYRVLAIAPVLRTCDDDARGAHDAVAEPVALLDDVDDRALLGVRRLREQRLVDVRIERARRLDLAQAVSLEQSGECAVHQPDAVLECGLLMLRRRDERTLEIVEDRQQLLHEPLVRERDELLPLARRALAEVVEVGGRPLPAVDRLVAFGLQSSEVILAALLDLRLFLK